MVEQIPSEDALRFERRAARLAAAYAEALAQHARLGLLPAVLGKVRVLRHIVKAVLERPLALFLSCHRGRCRDAHVFRQLYRPAADPFRHAPPPFQKHLMVVLFPERSKKCKNKTAAPVFQRDSSYSACRYSKSSSVTPKYFSAKSTRSTRNSFPRRYSSAPASVGNSKRSL